MARAKHVSAGVLVEDQAATIAWLADPATHGGAAVERIETHASVVVLAGGRAYKLKRAVRYPFLDYGTPELRRRACHDEVALNRRTAPALYLGVAPIARRDGGLRLGALGEDAKDAVDWLVVMRRFDQAGLFDRLATAGGLSRALMERTGEVIAAFHAEAEHRPSSDGTGMLAWVLEDNVAELRGSRLAGPEVERLARACSDALDRARPLLDARAASGFARVCHGDLHLRNICLIEGRPTLFDAIEFNERLTVIDVLYDLAFLVMDLEHRGLRPIANALLNRWLQAIDDLEGLAALPLFLALRAGVRAKVGASAEALSDKASTEPEAYLDLALRLIAPPAPVLLAIGGPSGTGKSTLARALAPLVGPAPGAVLSRSDVLRKRLLGVAETEPLPKTAYAPEVTAEVYTALRKRCARALAARHGAIADGVHAKLEERVAIETIAREAGARFVGLWLDAPERTMIERVEARHGDASDADAAVVRAQAAYEVGALSWRRIDASGPPERTLDRARAALA